MKLKRLTQIALVTCGVLAMVACSTARHGNRNACCNSDSAMMDANGAQASGIGENDNFGGGPDEMSQGQGQGRNKRVYYFDFDRSDVREEDKPAIFANADYLMNHPRVKVTVEGHTDPRGSREYNVALAERRANAVADLLRSKGVSSSQIRVVSYGAERLAAPGRSEQDFQLDRRAVIVCQQR